MKKNLLYGYLLFITALLPTLITFNSAVGWFALDVIIFPTLTIFFALVTCYLLLRTFLKLSSIQSCNITIVIALFIGLYNYISINIAHYFSTLISSYFFLHAFVILIFIGIFVATLLQKKSVYLMGAIVHTFFLSSLVQIIESYDFIKLDPPTNNPKTIPLALSVNAQSPDIFYIIPDCYASNKVIQQTFKYDNSSFTDTLENKGFYIPTKSRSNYTATRLSLAATLNIDYLDSFIDIEKNTNITSTYPYYAHNRVMKSLDKAGYQLKFMPSPYPPTDYLLQSFDSPISTNQSKKGISFNSILKNISLLDFFFPIDREQKLYDLYDKAFKDIQTLYKNHNIADGPLFTYTHLLLPHAPYIIDDNGNKRNFMTKDDILTDGGLAMYDRWKADYPQKTDKALFQYARQGYINNIHFFNERLLKFIDYMQENHHRPYLILVQSDHGCNDLETIVSDHRNDQKATDRIPYNTSHIFAAFYFSDQNYQLLYDDISSVNLFRVIFNQYFNQKLPLLRDTTYISYLNSKDPFDYIEYVP